MMTSGWYARCTLPCPALPCPSCLYLAWSSYCFASVLNIIQSPVQSVDMCEHARSEDTAVYQVLCMLQSQAPSEGARPTYNLQAIQLLRRPMQVAGPDSPSCCIAVALDYTTGDMTCDLMLN